MQALDVGELVQYRPGMEVGPTCYGYDLIDHRTPADNVSVIISEKYGIVAIFASRKC